LLEKKMQGEKNTTNPRQFGQERRPGTRQKKKKKKKNKEKKGKNPTTQTPSE
jgi:hypothetical protein